MSQQTNELVWKLKPTDYGSYYIMESIETEMGVTTKHDGEEKHSSGPIIHISHEVPFTGKWVLVFLELFIFTRL